MSSAAEAKLGDLFINAKDAVPIRTTLIEMNWPQPLTPIQVYNSTAVVIANQTIKQKMYKAMDTRFYWVIDRIKQVQFRVYWRPGSTNISDYPTKHHKLNTTSRSVPFISMNPKLKTASWKGVLIPPPKASRLTLTYGRVSRIKYVIMHVSTIIYANP